jgi:hypothetical protein
MFIVPEKYRVRENSLYATDPSFGNNGFFVIPHHRIQDYQYNCIASDGEGWQHVSITLSKITRKPGKVIRDARGNKSKQIILESGPVERCATWEEMCYIKSIFWADEDCVIQFHPAKADHVNMHQFCLHLWRPTEQTFPTPDPLMVGYKQTEKIS